MVASARARAAVGVLAFGAAVAAAVVAAAAQSPPPDLSALAASARLDGQVSGWCRGEFRAGHPDAYAVAVTAANGGGRYVVLESEVAAVNLAVFRGSPEISCYAPERARELHVAIRSSATIHGQIVPVWSTTVICAFVEGTRAVCWQYSPDARAFVQVGEWIT